MGAAARERAMEFNWDAILAQMNTYYDEVLANPVASSFDGTTAAS